MTLLQGRKPGRWWRRKGLIYLCCCLCLLGSCGPLKSLRPTDVRIIEHHASSSLQDIESLITRLYAKNPKYELEVQDRRRKLRNLFREQLPTGSYSLRSSRELLTEAFAERPMDDDRVYLLGLGLVKSIREAYGLDDRKVFISGLQLERGRLERLHHNISQVNWRLKTYKNGHGELLFQTNAIGADGYFNMGYEVLITQILTRIEDDVYLRGGSTGKYLFDMGTMFLSIVL